jgi:hypothetical protein
MIGLDYQLVQQDPAMKVGQSLEAAVDLILNGSTIMLSVDVPCSYRLKNAMLEYVRNTAYYMSLITLSDMYMVKSQLRTRVAYWVYNKQVYCDPVYGWDSLLPKRSTLWHMMAELDAGMIPAEAVQNALPPGYTLNDIRHALLIAPRLMECRNDKEYLLREQQLLMSALVAVEDALANLAPH